MCSKVRGSAGYGLCVAYCEANDCDLFEPKVTVEMTRDQSRSEGSFAPTAASIAGGQAPKTQTDARKAFDDLFKS